MKSEKRVLFLLAASAGVILLVTVLTLFSGKDESAGKKHPSAKLTGTAPVAEVTAEQNKLMMVKAVDTVAGTIALYDLEEGGEVTLSYGVAADIRTKYGNLTYAATLQYGNIVRAEYDGENRLVRMQLSGEHWELNGVEEFSIAGTMLTVNESNYKITEHTVAYCEGRQIAVGEVKDVDRVELCGKDAELLTIRVVKGHGSIKLVNGGELQGAKVSFGDESHVLTGEPTYLVREGNYTVSVIGEETAAVAEVSVARNEQVVIDLYEYGGAPAETAEVRFKITPFSTMLKIDGERVDYYEQDLVLEYGEHKIEAELGGYVTYKGYLTVSKPYHTFRIDLPERTVADGESTGNTDPEDGEDSSGNEDGEQTADGTGQTGDGEADTEYDTEDGEEWRYAEIGEAGGYTYDEDRQTIIAIPAGAIVEIDGHSIGTAPVRFEKIIGTYTITLRKNGKEKEYTVTVEDDGEDVIWRFPEF